MKKLGLIAGILLVLASCNKEQRAAKKLEGTWNVTSETWTSPDISYDAIADLGQTSTYTFGSCDVKKNQGCTVHIYTKESSGEVSSDQSFDYRLDDDGNKWVLGPGAVYETNWNVETLSSDKFEISTFLETGSYNVKIIMEKAD